MIRSKSSTGSLSLKVFLNWQCRLSLAEWIKIIIIIIIIIIPDGYMQYKMSKSKILSLWVWPLATRRLFQSYTVTN